MPNGIADQEILLQDAVESDGPSAARRWALQSALDTHAVAVADAAQFLKTLTITKKIDSGNEARITALAEQHAYLLAIERITRWNVDNAVADLAEAEVAATKRFQEG